MRTPGGGKSLAIDVRSAAVLIGNAAAALQGAPVTTVDFDFLFRKTPRTLLKLKAMSTALGATILRPFYPASDLYRLVRDDDGLQLDFMVRARRKADRAMFGVRPPASRDDATCALRCDALRNPLCRRPGWQAPPDDVADGQRAGINGHILVMNFVTELRQRVK